jgi:hypothetical protein
MASHPTIRVNRAPVLTLWAAVVAERFGHPPDTALSLARAVAGTAARAKARRLGIAEERDHSKDAQAAAPARPQDTAQLLGRKIRLTHDADGVVLAEGEGKPRAVQRCAASLVSPGRNRSGQNGGGGRETGFPDRWKSDSWGGNRGGGCRDRVCAAAGTAGGGA